MNHTNFTWTLDKRGDVMDERGVCLFECCDEGDDSRARLIASAPMLLEALKGLCGHIASVQDWQRAHDAIAAAEGNE